MDKKRFAAILFGLTLLCTVVVSGENLLKNGDAENGGVNWPGIKISSDEAKAGKNCFELSATDQTALSEEFIPVEGTGKYKISGFLKNCGKSPCRVLIGLVPYDKNKQQILSTEVNTVSGSETVLAKACKPGDKILKVKDAGKWKIGADSLVVFNADDSGNYADLPNRFKTASGIDTINNKNGIWEVTLSKNCGKEYPAETKVREHVTYNTYIYPVILDIKPEDAWKKISGTIYDTASSGAAEKQFWPGTAFVKLMIYKLSDNKLLFDDLSFENIPVKKSLPGQGGVNDVLNGGFENWTGLDNVPANWDVPGKLIPEKWGVENRPDGKGKICRIINSSGNGSGKSLGKYSLLLNGRLVSQHVYDKVKDKKIKVSLMAKGNGGNITVRLRESLGRDEDMYVIHLMEIINADTGDKWCKYTGDAVIPSAPAYVEPSGVALEIIGKDVAIDNVQVELSDAKQQFSPIIYNLPAVPDKVVIDGNFSEQEWSGAAGMNSGFMAVGGNMLKRQAEYYLSSDNKNLLICLRAPFTEALKQQIGDRDGNVWEDDSYEIHISPTPGQNNPPRTYQFIINALGTVYDACSADKNWNCAGIKTASKCGDNIWTLEVAIPLAEVGLQPGREFGFNICRNLKNPDESSTLTGEGYFDYGKMLLLRINKDCPAIFWGSSGTIGDGNLELFARASNKSAKTQDCEISFSVDAEQVAKKETRKLTLQPSAQETIYFNLGKDPGGFGEIKLNAQSSTDKTAIAVHKINFDRSTLLTQETGNRIAYYPVQNKIGVILTGEQLGKAAKVEVTVTRNGTVVEKMSTDKIEISMDKKGQAMVNFTPPADADYLVSAAVFDKENNCLGYVANNVVVQKPAWLNNDCGKEKIICRPFIPLTQNGRTLSCWGRQYTFAGSGLPEQIVSQNENVLTSPVAFVWMDGSKAVHGKPGEFKITSFSDQSATFTGKTFFNNFKIVTHGRLEYDGTIFYDIDIMPQGNITIPNLHLEMPFSNLKYFHTQNLWMSSYPEKGEYIDSTVPVWTPGYTPQGVRGHNSLYLPKGDGIIWTSKIQNDFIPYLTFGNTINGMCWFADNDRGWSRDLKKPSYEVIRTGVSSRVQVNLISKPLKTAAVDRISFALAATPVRPRKTGFNQIKWGVFDFGACSFIDKALAGLAEKDNFLLDKYLAAVNPNGDISYLFYIAKAYFSLGDPAARYFYNEWHTTPEASYDSRSLIPQKKYGLNPDNYFGPAGCMYPERVDYIASKIDTLMKNNPRLRGIYWDENYSVPCRDIFHRSCGFRLEDGSIQAGIHYYGLRELDKRVQTIFQKYNRAFPNLLDHCTDMVPPLYSFCDINLCAERGTKNLDFIDYWDLPRIENTGAGAWGIDIMWIPQWEQAITQGGPNTLANNRSMLAALKLFDFSILESWCLPDLLAKFRTAEGKFGTAEDDSKFFGYWQKENKQAVSGMPVFVKSSFFVRPGKGALVYVSNLNKARQKVQLQLDFNKWNINNFKISDTENGQEIKHDGKSVTIDIEGHDFRNLHIEQVR